MRKTGANTQEAREVLSMGPGQYFGERHLLGASVRPVSAVGGHPPPHPGWLEGAGEGSRATPAAGASEAGEAANRQAGKPSSSL
jgi:hypothetical protein